MKDFHQRISKNKLYSEYVKMLNGYLGLSKREAEIFSFIVKLDTEWQPKSGLDFKDVLSTSNRKLIIRECNINKTNLSRFIAVLKVKGLISTNKNGGYELPAKLTIDSDTRLIETLFTFEIIEDEITRQNSKTYITD